MWASLRPDAMAVLKNKKARSSLSRYFDVMQNRKEAKFRIAKKLVAHFNKDDTTPRLWEKHNRLVKEHLRLERQIGNGSLSFEELETPDQSFLDLKIEIANRILLSCHFCTRRCSANRKEDEIGYCKSGSQVVVSTISTHMGEEPELVPSGTIFTLGCTMRCVHCQNWTISQWMESGEIYSPRRLAAAVEHLRNSGCRNANLVGGDPTPWLASWLEAFECVTVNVPIVWNSNSYYSEETARLLAGFADVYLLDFKYGNNECAKRISDAPSYWEACTRNHRSGKEHGELLIRILILPNHLDCCAKKTLKWISTNLGPTTRTNVMFQYRPEWRAYEQPELRRRLTKAEKEKAAKLAKAVGLVNFIT